MSKLDLRKAGLVTPVHDQGYWGSCWAFSAMAAYESSYLINCGASINASEEYVVNCSNAGGWDGGWPYKVTFWMTSQQKNVCDESSLPYNGPPQKCPSQVPTNKEYLRGLIREARDRGENPYETIFEEAFDIEDIRALAPLIGKYF